MIRLRVSGADGAVWRKVALQVRQVALEPRSEACDAAVFVGPLPDSQEVERFLASGKHVLLATDRCFSGDVLESLSAAARNGTRLTVVNPDRYRPSRQLIRRSLEAGKLGAVGLVRIHRWESAMGSEERDPLGFPPALVRDLDLATWLIGKQADRVYALASESSTPGTRFVQVHLSFPDGPMAMIDHTDRLPPGDGYHSLTVIGSGGAAYADDHQNAQLLYRGGHPQAVRTEEGTAGLTTLVQEFVASLHSGWSATVPAWQHVWSLVAFVRTSLESRLAVGLEGR